MNSYSQLVKQINSPSVSIYDFKNLSNILSRMPIPLCTPAWSSSLPIMQKCHMIDIDIAIQFSVCSTCIRDMERVNAAWATWCLVACAGWSGVAEDTFCRERQCFQQLKGIYRIKAGMYKGTYISSSSSMLDSLSHRKLGGYRVRNKNKR